MPELIDSVLQEWRATLGTDVTDRGANFFEYGGDSVMALSLIERLEEVWDVELPLEDFFVRPTLGDLVDMCRDAVGAET